MKFQLMSDLHFEFHVDGGEMFAEQVPVGAEVLLLAGDVAPMHDFFYLSAMQAMCKRFEEVIYAPGNHEFYGGEVQGVLANLRELPTHIPNLRLLEPGTILRYPGVRVLGGSGWFPEQPDDAHYFSLINDFTEIRGLLPWAYEEYARLRSFLQENLDHGDLVMTHHLPSYQSVPTRYLGSGLNRFFVAGPGFEDLMVDRSPFAWVHGHTHDSCQYSVGMTWVYCNPYGYYEQINSRFRYQFLIESPLTIHV